MSARTSLLAGVIGLASGCAAPPVRVEPQPPSLVTWRTALAELKALRLSATGNEPHTLKLSLALKEPFTGRRTEARGAVAISPAARALRMILVGPGGTTAFDLWVKDDKFRVAIPAVDLLRRGDAATPRAEMRGLPVAFLRWWLLNPAGGELLWTERTARERRYWLREGGAVTSLFVKSDQSITAERHTWTDKQFVSNVLTLPVLIDHETVDADRAGCGRARYTQASTGVEIEIACEGVEPNPPSERAFLDPDAAEEEAP